MPESDSSRSQPTRRSLPLPWFQFSLARLMIVVAGLAVLLFVATRIGSFVQVVLFSLVTCVVPTPLVICAVFGRGDVRAFSLGALNPWVVSIALRFPGPYEGTFFQMIWLVAMGGICGVIAVFTRRCVWHDKL
jgi:hypothetical protein